MENTNTTNNNNNKNNDTSASPTPCAAGCGFFGNEAFNDMCSKCYKEKNKDSLVSIKSPSKDDTTIITSIEKSRKHLRSPSPDILSAPTSSAASPLPTNTTENNEKVVQLNKGRCFKCRLKVPLAKQAANKCRCGYVFCDSHRYPDRHDCDIDYAKLDREILAKNNPKLHERPKGGRSFQRIDSL